MNHLEERIKELENENVSSKINVIIKVGGDVAMENKKKFCKQCGIELHKQNNTQSKNYCDDCDDEFVDGDLYEDFDSF